MPTKANGLLYADYARAMKARERFGAKKVRVYPDNSVEFTFFGDDESDAEPTRRPPTRPNGAMKVQPRSEEEEAWAEKLYRMNKHVAAKMEERKRAKEPQRQEVRDAVETIIREGLWNPAQSHKVLAAELTKRGYTNPDRNDHPWGPTVLKRFLLTGEG